MVENALDVEYYNVDISSLIWEVDERPLCGLLVTSFWLSLNNLCHQRTYDLDKKLLPKAYWSVWNILAADFLCWVSNFVLKCCSTEQSIVSCYIASKRHSLEHMSWQSGSFKMTETCRSQHPLPHPPTASRKNWLYYLSNPSRMSCGSFSFQLKSFSFREICPLVFHIRNTKLNGLL
jgi:hypothetical protein